MENIHKGESGRNINIFSNLDDENKESYRAYASMTPEESLAIVTKMRLTAHPSLNNTNLNPWGTEIYFQDKADVDQLQRSGSLGAPPDKR